MLNLNDSFRRLSAPGTNRSAIQLTQGERFCYPLYYYIPTLTADDRYLVYHEASGGQIQLHCLDLRSGEDRQLTHANAADTWWRPWCINSGSGVLDHRSVLNRKSGEVIYFDGADGNSVNAVHVPSGKTRHLFDLPKDRMAIGQNCITPDGGQFIYIQADRATYLALFPEPPDWRHYWPHRNTCRGTRLMAYDLDSGAQRMILAIDSPIHHVFPYDDNRLLFCHPTAENGLLMTDLRGGWYTHLRTQDERGGKICHFVATKRGIPYEVLERPDGIWSGLCDPDRRQFYEFLLPRTFGYTHTGLDPEGLLWFYENQHGPQADRPAAHDLHFLQRHNPGGEDHWLALTGDWPTYGGGQKSHFHPQVVLNRQHILMTAGDERTRTNHIYLLDIADLTPTQGIRLPA
ncbi:MAG TPA: hypothetical protein VIL86_08810 [Tepidisphaeraceae bacterium]|jgi:hypothetical protein